MTAETGEGLRRWGARLGGVAAFAAAWALLGYTAPDIDSPNDRDAFFLPAAEQVLAGRPLGIYAVRSPDGYPNDNGPLGVYALAAAVGVTKVFHGLEPIRVRTAWICGLLSLISLFLGREVIAAVDRLRPGWLAAPRRRLLAWVAIGLSPPLWVAVVYFGHDELPLMLALVMAGVRSLATDRPVAAGAAFGAAMLTKTTASVYVAALLVLLAMRRDWRSALQASGSAALVTAAGGLALLLADFPNAWYSLIGFRAKAHVLGGSLWSVFPGPTWESLARQYDGIAVLVAAIVSTAAVARHRPDLSAMSADAYGVLTLAALCTTLFIRSLWAYYWLEPFAFGAAWVLAIADVRTPQGRLLFAALIWMALASVLTLGVHMLTPLGPMTQGRSIAVTSLTLCAAVPTALCLWRRADVGASPAKA